MPLTTPLEPKLTPPRVNTDPWPAARSTRHLLPRQWPAAFAATTLALALALSGAAAAAPRVPASDTELLETLPTRANDADARTLAALRAAAARAPADPGAAAALAQHHFDRAAALGDPRHIGYAEAVLARFPPPLPAALRLVRGQLRQYRHQFDEALDDFAGALALDPTLATAHAWRGAIFLVQARYPAAEAECAALQRLGRAALHAGCQGLVQAYGGRLVQAEATLQQALAGTRDDDQRLWLLTRLGEVAAWRGQPARAERHYRAALDLDRDDAYLLAAWADFLLDQGRPAEVASLLAARQASDPLLLRLAEAEALLQRPGAERLRQTLVERFAAARQRGDTTHEAEEARCALRLQGRPAEALRLALDNYQVQREPRDARILLEAATAAGRPEAADAVRAWLRSSGFEDARLRQLAGLGGPAGAATGPAR